MLNGKAKLLAAILGSAVAVAAHADEPKLQPLKYNNPGLVVDLAVGLGATPIPIDYDGDGKTDLVVVSSDKPYNGIYFFRNPDGGAMPVFKPGVRLTKARTYLQPSYVDGKVRILRPNEELVNLGKADESLKKLGVSKANTPTADGLRANLWRFVDYDGNGVQDLVVGVEDWAAYGWDDAFDSAGTWKNGPLHGYVYLLMNDGTNDAPNYRAPTKVEAAGQPIDQFGMPSPCFADFTSDGKLDLICGNFLDSLTYFENIGTRSEPKYAAGKTLMSADGPIHMDACMINPVAFDWDGDGHVDLIVGQEDGRVALIRNTGQMKDGLPLFEAPKFFQQEADEVKFGSLVTPVAFDWDGDGREDLICGNAAGYIGFFKNLDGAAQPKWAAPQYLEADGQPIRILAGPNGSTQGPAEAKWGYTTVTVADWDGDGLPDLIVNSIWGKVVWFKNIGTRTQPKLAAAKPIEVAWPSNAPRPAWDWWTPTGRELVTQWRTTPIGVDLNGDGKTDLVMLDRDGYLSCFERSSDSLLPPKHVFHMATGEPSVFDHNHKAVTFKDGVTADLTKPDSTGRLTFYESNPANRADISPTKFADRAGDAAYNNAAGDELRLSGGWSGRSGRRKLALVDFDGDGKLDLLVNSTNVNFLRNVATKPGEFIFHDTGPLDTRLLAGHDTSPAVAHFAGDAIPDLIVGAEDGHIYFMNNPRRSNPLPAAQAHN